MKRIRLNEIVFDAGTQVRAELDQDHVMSIAEALESGAVLPPIVLFHDGNHYYIGDGFHRYMAATRLQWREIDAEIRPGSKTEALWFALGANRTNGKNMTPADKRHAILLALQTWPDKSISQIATQIGVNQGYASEIKKQVIATNNLSVPTRVTGKDGKSYPASRPASAPKRHAKADAIEERVRKGERVEDIVKALHVAPMTVAAIRKELGIETVDRSPSAVKQRRARIRDMATDGYTSTQIADAVGLSVDGCREIIRREQIDVPADRVTRGSRSHDSTRIMEHIVMDAENLTADVKLIDFGDLDPKQIPAWIDSLSRSKKLLDGFIRQLVKEMEKHGEAA